MTRNQLLLTIQQAAESVKASDQNLKQRLGTSGDMLSLQIIPWEVRELNPSTRYPTWQEVLDCFNTTENSSIIDPPPPGQYLP